MSVVRNAASFVFIVLALFASGCPAPTPVEGTIRGIVDKSRVASARVQLFGVNTSLSDLTADAATQTNESGEFGFEVGAISPTFQVCATDGTYIDEATGNEHTLASNLCATVKGYEPGETIDVVVSPVTTLVSAYAECLLRTGKQSTPEESLDRAEALFADYFGIGASGYTPTSTVPFPVTDALAPDLDAATWAGLLNAGLSQAALRIAEVSGLEPGVRVSAATLTEALVQDLSDEDCVFDGGGANGQIVQGEVELSADTLRGAPQGLLAGMLEFADFGRNASGITAEELRPTLEELARFESPLFGTIGRRPDLDPPTGSFIEPTDPTFFGEVSVLVVFEDESPIVSCGFVGFEPLAGLVPDFESERTRCSLTGTFNSADLGEGPLTLVAEARDEVGNRTRLTFDGTVDNSPPTLTAISLSEGQRVSGTLTVSATAEDAAGIASLVVAGAQGLSDTVPANDRFESTWDTTSEAEGPLTLQFVATDGNGLTLTQDVTVLVDNLEGRTFSGQVSVGGAIETANVRVLRFDDKSEIVAGETDDDGSFQLVDNSAYAGPVIAIATGGFYEDVATATVFELGGSLQAVIPTTNPGDDAVININGLTSLAAQRALVSSGDPDDLINESNALFAAHVRRPSPFVLTEEEVPNLATTIVPLASAGSALGLFHAGLSRMAADLSIAAQGQVGAVTIDGIVTVLQSDLEDGQLDGRLFDVPLNVSLDGFADSYTLRRDLAVSTHLFITNAPLEGSTAVNGSGIEADALRAVGAYYDDVSLNDDERLFPTAALPLPFDELAPQLLLTFGGANANALLGDALDGVVTMVATAEDASGLRSVSVVAPEVEDTSAALDVVTVSFDRDVLPNMESVASACGVDVSLPPYSLLQNQVCACVEAQDVLANAVREMLCFTRPPLQLLRTRPNGGSGDIYDGDVEVEYRAVGGFALTEFTLGEGAADAPDLTTRRVTIESNTVDAEAFPNVNVPVFARDALGTENADAFVIGRMPLEIAFAGVDEDELLRGSDLPRQVFFDVASAYSMEVGSCEFRVLESDGSTVGGSIRQGTFSADRRLCSGSYVIGASVPDDELTMRVRIVDINGDEQVQTLRFSKDAENGFSSTLVSPTPGALVSEATILGEATATDPVANASLSLTTPSGTTSAVTVSIDGQSISFNLGPGDLAQDGTYSLVLTTTSTLGQNHITPPLNFTVDRTGPTIAVRQQNNQGAVFDMDVQFEKSTILLAGGGVELRPIGPQTKPNWEAFPTFRIWSALTDSAQYAPSLAFVADDNLPGDLAVHYRVGQFCQGATTSDPVAETSRIAIRRSTVSVVDLSRAGSYELCISVTAYDEAGNASASSEHPFTYVVIPAPIYLEVESARYDPAFNPLDFAFYEDEMPLLFNGFAVPPTEVPAELFCDSAVSCEPTRIPPGYAYASAVLTNPWSEPVRAAAQIQNYIPAEVQFSTRQVLVMTASLANKYWSSSPPLAQASLRNPRHPLAGAPPSSSTPEGTTLSSSATVPRWTRACDGLTDFGARLTAVPPAYPVNTRTGNECIKAGDPFSANFSGRDLVTASVVQNTTTFQSGQNNLDVAPEPTAANVRYFLLGEDGAVAEELNAPVILPADGNNTILLEPGQSVVALWFGNHSSPLERLFFNQRQDNDEYDSICPLLNAGPLYRGGNADNGVMAEDVNHVSLSVKMQAAPIFSHYGSTYPCAATVVAPSSSDLNCNASNARCYLDRGYRHMTALRIRSGAPASAVQATATAASTTLPVVWGAQSHRSAIPQTLRTIAK